MKLFVISDLHMGHWNIVRYCNRPFKSLDEMNSKLIHNYNERVKPEDMVYNLGDFCFKNTPGGKEGEGSLERADHWRSKLNGQMVLLRGNHDRNNSAKGYIDRMYITYGTFNIELAHRPEDLKRDADFSLCGHVHDKWKHIWIDLLGAKAPEPQLLSDPHLVINCGVDVWNFRPVHMDEILAYRAKVLREEKK